MGQPTNMSSSNGLQQQQQQNVQQQQQQGKKLAAHRSGYNKQAMAEIRDSLRPYEQQEQQQKRLAENGFVEVRKRVSERASMDAIPTLLYIPPHLRRRGG